MYHKLKEISDDLIENIRPGIKCSEIYTRAIEKSKKLNVTETFLNFGRGQKARMIGHGIGLEVNEPPILSTYDDSKILSGFVISIEMHMMDENIGVVKLEDMILITNTGNEILTKSPRHLFEV
jgi:Xaa-Pro aminopeptidase